MHAPLSWMQPLSYNQATWYPTVPKRSHLLPRETPNTSPSDLSLMDAIIVPQFSEGRAARRKICGTMLGKHAMSGPDLSGQGNESDIRKTRHSIKYMTLLAETMSADVRGGMSVHLEPSFSNTARLLRKCADRAPHAYVCIYIYIYIYIYMYTYICVCEHTPAMHDAMSISLQDIRDSPSNIKNTHKTIHGSRRHLGDLGLAASSKR